MNIIVVEDTKIVRLRLVALLEGLEGVDVVAAVECAEEALEFMADSCIDLVILDLCLPGLSDDQAVQAIKRANPDVEILIYTVSENDEKVFPALKAGATGYLLKSDQESEITAAIEEIMAGGSPMTPSIARKVVREFQRALNHEALKETTATLSRREIQILELLYRGHDTMEVANSLCISRHTVKAHIKKIYAKLYVNSRSQAVYEALNKKLIKPE
ncbi:response regulator transcription factor [Geomonas agri]|uniref:response regulator transcription factor n=1 Tax=Geomonas agri TaxID=2873702 RepID=UPI001CD22DBF|nr:response regulator transcription factor [Geomonas agri]